MLTLYLWKIQSSALKFFPHIQRRFLVDFSFLVVFFAWKLVALEATLDVSCLATLPEGASLVGFSEPSELLVRPLAPIASLLCSIEDGT